MEEICDAPESIVHLIGKRYENLKLQEEELYKQLCNERRSTSSINNLLNEVTQKLLQILFGFDYLAKSAVRQSDQHLMEYKPSQPLFDG